MSEAKRAKLPKTLLNVEYVTLAGTKMVQVQPEGDKVTIGATTAIVPRERIGFDKKKGGAWCRVAEGNPIALPLFQEAKMDGVTARQLDQTAHNNLLEQLNSLAKQNRAPGITWAILICMGILALVVVGVAVNQHNDLKDLKAQVALLVPAHALNQCTPTPGNPCTVDATAPSQQQQGHLIGTPPGS
jgi:hypothetical protein